MDDIASLINNVLGSKEGMEQLQSMANSLGLGSALQDGLSGMQQQNTSNPEMPFQETNSFPSLEPPEAPQSQNNGGMAQAFAGILNNLGKDSSSPSDAPSENTQGFSMPNIDMNMIMNIQKAMSAFQSSSQNVSFLTSLKPHFSEGRQKKVDDAIKLMQLISMLPMLKESGLFGFLSKDKS